MVKVISSRTHLSLEQGLLHSIDALEEGFVYLQDIDPSIQTDLRYYSKENFLGRLVEGYKASKMILTERSAVALKKAQEYFVSKGFSLLVYDAYRPQDAVNDFLKWASDSSYDTKEEYYPRVEKKSLFELGYLMEKSGHSRGSTVDVSLLSLSRKISVPIKEKRTLNGFEFIYLNDGTLDMGGAFDMFDELSHVKTEGLTQVQQDNRNFLHKGMKDAGFKPYENEWWHFTLENEPFADTYFNFPIE